MPHLRIETNVSKDKVPENFLKEVSALLAKTIGKPEGYCCVTVVPDQLMIWGGTEAPCATTILMSIGQLGQKENISHSKILFEKICKDLGIEKTRMYITFNDAKASDIGHNGTTFHEIFGLN